jgi:hypothetical protein
MSTKIKLGDTVRVWAFAYDTEYSATGVVEQTQQRADGNTLLYVQGNWWKNTNDALNGCELVIPEGGKISAITLRIGTLGIGGGVDEKHTFTTAEAFRSFLSARVPELDDEHYNEILSHPDTQFNRSEMIFSPAGDAAYWGRRRYEIEVKESK